jgi:N-acetylglutamate synthase-like GNAT family acetyltransferase
MNAADYRVRRATLDDMPQLTKLWQSMRFDADDLSRRVTEFQVVESADAAILGGIGMQIAEKHGRLHSEFFSDFSLADTLRPLLWERLKTIATNHGLLRIWTLEQAPFWHQIGLTEPDPETTRKLPLLWRALPGKWLTLKLKEDIDTILSADKEFAAFMDSERESTKRALQQAKSLKVAATVFAIVILGFVLLGILLLLSKNPQFFHR